MASSTVVLRRRNRQPLGYQATGNYPVITLPATQSVEVDNLPETLAAITVADEVETALTMAVNISLGVFSLNSTTGLDFGIEGGLGDGTNDARMVFYGTITNINTALSAISISGQVNSQVSLVVTATNTTGSTTKVLTINVGDLTAPTLSSPTATKVGSSQVNTQVNTNDATGTGYVVLTTSSTTPSAGNIVIGLDHLGGPAVATSSDTPTAGVLGPVSFTGLTPGTTYYAHWAHQDGNNNLSAAISSSGATTDTVNNPVLTLILDDLYSEPPTFSFLSSAPGTLTIDFDSAETEPDPIGSGNITSFTLTVAEGENSFDRSELSAFYGAVGYLHFTLEDEDTLVSNTLTSRQVRVDNALLAPSNTVLPQILGVPEEGLTATATNGTWAGYPIPTYTYQWKRDGVNINGATTSSYTYVSADVANDITYTVTATNSEGSASATSAAVVPSTSSDQYLLENGTDFYLTEDDGFYLLELGAFLMENGTDFYLNEDGVNLYPVE